MSPGGPDDDVILEKAPSVRTAAMFIKQLAQTSVSSGHALYTAHHPLPLILSDLKQPLAYPVPQFPLLLNDDRVVIDNL